MTKPHFAAFMAALARVIPRGAPNLADGALLDAWFEALGHLSPEQATEVYKQAIRSCDFFPSIREVLAFSGSGELSAKDKAREVAERIWAATERWPVRWPDPDQQVLAEAMRYIGPIGIEVVRLQGGWRATCRIAASSQVVPLKAQWRELALVLQRPIAAGMTLEAPPDFEKLPPKATVAPVRQLTTNPSARTR